MTYDRDHGKVLMVGNTARGEVWEWDGESWTSFPAVPVDCGVNKLLSYDSIRKRLVQYITVFYNDYTLPNPPQT